MAQYTNYATKLPLYAGLDFKENDDWTTVKVDPWYEYQMNSRTSKFRCC